MAALFFNDMVPDNESSVSSLRKSWFIVFSVVFLIEMNDRGFVKVIFFAGLACCVMFVDCVVVFFCCCNVACCCVCCAVDCVGPGSSGNSSSCGCESWTDDLALKLYTKIGKAMLEDP